MALSVDDYTAPGTTQRTPTSFCICQSADKPMLKVIGWIVGILVLIGLLVVIGVFDLIL